MEYYLHLLCELMIYLFISLLFCGKTTVDSVGGIYFFCLIWMKCVFWLQDNKAPLLFFCVNFKSSHFIYCIKYKSQMCLLGFDSQLIRHPLSLVFGSDKGNFLFGAWQITNQSSLKVHNTVSDCVDSALIKIIKANWLWIISSILLTINSLLASCW